MNKHNMIGVVWTVVAILYGIGVWAIDERWFTVGGAMFFALLAITQQWWSQLLPDDQNR